MLFPFTFKENEDFNTMYQKRVCTITEWGDKNFTAKP